MYIHSPAFTRDRLPDTRPNVTRHKYTTKGAVATKHQKYMRPKTMEAPVPKKRTEKRDENAVEHLEGKRFADGMSKRTGITTSDYAISDMREFRQSDINRRRELTQHR
jgi:hypothetical protein